MLLDLCLLHLVVNWGDLDPVEFVNQLAEKCDIAGNSPLLSH